VTSRAAVDVMAEIQKALWEMGIEVVKETEFKAKCTRRGKKRAPASRMSTSASSSAAPADRRIPSPNTSQLSSSPSTGFRSLFARQKSSNSVGQPSPSLSLSTSTQEIPETSEIISSPMSPMSPMVIPRFVQVQQPQPIYGEGASVDSGDEIRFSVELTRLKNFTGLYSVDIRRLRGQLWAFGFVYGQLLQRLELEKS